MSEGSIPYLTTDQVRAFVELSRHGQIRSAARVLGLTEQGVRNRVIALERQLGVELYRKYRGPRKAGLLTEHGRRFVPQALAFLERARELCRTFEIDAGVHEIRVAASQYLIRYLLIDVLAAFRKAQPSIQVRVSTMTEREVEDALLREPDVAFGLAAPYEPSLNLDYHELFAMTWSLIAPRRHGAIGKAPGKSGAKSAAKGAAKTSAKSAGKSAVRLADIADLPLILYERGSTGRQHVLDAFHERNISPKVAFETTSTETIVSMVEAGLGVALVPLLPTGAVTRGRRVEARPVEQGIRPIHSGLLLRRGEALSPAAQCLADFITSRFASRSG